MMRLPLPVIFAALIVVAAGSILLSIEFSADEPFIINATGLNSGENVTVTLDFIPRNIMVLSHDAGAFYIVYVYADATFKDPWPWWPVLTDGFIIYSLPANGTTEVKVVDVRSTKTKIVVIRW